MTQYSRARTGGGILSSLLSRSAAEAKSPQTAISSMVTDGDLKRLKMKDREETSDVRRTPQEPCGHQCKLIKQVPIRDYNRISELSLLHLILPYKVRCFRVIESLSTIDSNGIYKLTLIFTYKISCIGGSSEIPLLSFVKMIYGRQLRRWRRQTT